MLSSVTLSNAPCGVHQECDWYAESRVRRTLIPTCGFQVTERVPNDLEIVLACFLFVQPWTTECILYVLYYMLYIRCIV